MMSLSRKLFGRDGRGRQTNRDDQLRFLSKSIQLEEAQDPRLAKLTTMSLSSIVLLLIGWSSVADINELARTEGQIEPYGSEREIQHVDGGAVAELHVSEGFRVNKSQLLITLDGAQLRQDLAQARQRATSLNIQIERLRAYLRGDNPNFAEVGPGGDQRIAEAIDNFRSMLASFRDRRAVAQRQYEQKRQELATLNTQLSATEKLVAISTEAETRLSELFLRKHAARDRYEAAVRRATQQRGNAEVLRMQIKTAEIAVEEFRSRLESVSSLDRAEAHRILHEATSQLAEAEELVVKLTNKLGALEIRSPVDGIVKGLSLTAVRSVARPAARLMTIVPIDEQLVARVQIKPKDIGNLKVGLPVFLKISAYDFGRYGSVPGRLAAISAATFDDGEGGRYFQGEVWLEKNFAGADSSRNPITPGMTVSADIVTGSRTVLEYLVKPIHSALDAALSER